MWANYPGIKLLRTLSVNSERGKKIVVVCLYPSKARDGKQLKKKGEARMKLIFLFFKLLVFLLFSLPTDLKVPTCLKIIPYDPKMM